MTAPATAEELYRTWRACLIAYFGKMVTYQDAEDLTHELFLRYLNAQANGTQIVQPTRWLWRAARNLAIDFYRARARRPPCVDGPAEDAADALASDPLELALVWDDRMDVARLVPLLSTPQREAVVLRHCYDRGFQQAADAAGIPLGAAKQRHQRAVARLRELMADSR